MEANTTNQPLLLVPKRKGVNKFLRAGSKRQTKVRAFKITYDRAHQGTPRGDSRVQDKTKVGEPKSSGRSSRRSTESQGSSSATGQISRDSSIKKKEKGSSSKTGSGSGSLQNYSIHEDGTEKQGRSSPLRQSKKGLSNQTSGLSSSSSKNRRETRSQRKVSDSGDDGGTNIPPDISDSDCENVSPTSQTRSTSRRRSPRKSISEILREEVRGGEQASSVSGILPRNVGGMSEENYGLDSEGPSGDVTGKAKELSEMLTKVSQVQTVMSSPLLSSARKKRGYSRMQNASLLKNTGVRQNRKNNERDVLNSDEDGSLSGSAQTGEKVDGNIAEITRSLRSDRTKQQALSVVQRDKNVTEMRDSEIVEDDEVSQARLKRLEKQLGGMTPVGFRGTGVASKSAKTVKSTQNKNKLDSVSSAQVDKEKTSSDEVGNSGNSQKHVSVSKTRTKKNSVSSSFEKDVGTPDELQKDGESKSKTKTKSRKEMQKVARTHSSSLHETQNVEDQDVSQRRRRGTSKSERSDSDNQNRTSEPEVSSEQAKKLKKLEKQLGGMSPMDRTLAMLSESRAKLAKTMPSLLDLSASQSKDDKDKKESNNLTRDSKQGKQGRAKSNQSTTPQSAKKRKESSSKQERNNFLRIKLKVNKKKKMARGKSKVLIDSDSEKDTDEMQLSESETDVMEELNLRRKRKISDLCDLDVVVKLFKEEGDVSRNDLKKKRLKKVHDDIMNSVTNDMLEMINLNAKMKTVTSLERKGHTKVTKKRKELLELQREHRKLCGRISDLKKEKPSASANPSTNEEISEFLNSLKQLYKEAGQRSSKMK